MILVVSQLVSYVCALVVFATTASQSAFRGQRLFRYRFHGQHTCCALDCQEECTFKQSYTCHLLAVNVLSVRVPRLNFESSCVVAPQVVLGQARAWLSRLKHLRQHGLYSSTIRIILTCDIPSSCFSHCFRCRCLLALTLASPPRRWERSRGSSGSTWRTRQLESICLANGARRQTVSRRPRTTIAFVSVLKFAHSLSFVRHAQISSS